MKLYILSFSREYLDGFSNPETLDCMELVKDLAQQNWEAYNSEVNSIFFYNCLLEDGKELTIMVFQDPEAFTPGLVLPYPVSVGQDGSLGPLDGFNEFPDFSPGSRVLGQEGAFIPDKITT